MLQIAGRVMRAAVEAIFAAVGHGHRAAAVSAGGKQTASASIGTVALLVRTDDALVGNRGRFRYGKMHLGREMITNAEPTLLDASAVFGIASHSGWAAV